MDRRGGDRRRRRYGFAFDVDAQAFFNAVVANSGALSAIEKGGYNTYRIDSKNNPNLWNPGVHADYPMMGGTAESMSINAQNPGNFDLIFVNTVAGDFTANGFTPNGLTSYARTGLSPDPVLIIQSVTLEYYSRDNTSENSCDIGAQVTSAQNLILFLDHSAVDTIFDSYNGGTGRVLGSTANVSGGVTSVRLAANDSKVYRKGVSYGSIATSGGTQPNVEFYIGARNVAGSADSFSTKECAGTLIGDGFNSAQVLAQYDARQTLNTTLSRQV